MRTHSTAAAVLLLALLACPPAFAKDADYEKGVSYLRAGRPDEAVRLLEPAAAREPDDAYVLYHLGLAYYKIGRLDDSSACFVKVEGLAGPKEKSGFGLGPAFTNLGMGFFRKGETEKASAALDRALASDPSDSDAHYYLGLVKAGMNDPAGFAEFERARELRPGDMRTAAATRVAAGLAYYRREEYRKASLELDKALEAEPGNVEALYYRGLSESNENGAAAARPYWEKLEKTAASGGDPATLFTIFFNMGVDFQNRDKPAEAAEMYGKASKLKPTDADAHYYRGYNLESLQDYPAAYDEYSRAAGLSPGMERAKAGMEVTGRLACESAVRQAKELSGREDHHAAAKLYRSAVVYDPSSGEAKKGLASETAALEREDRGRAARIRSLLAASDYVGAKAASDALNGFDPGSKEAVKAAAEVDRAISGAVSGWLESAKAAARRDALGESAGYYRMVLAVTPGDSSTAAMLRQAESAVAGERRKARSALEEGRLASAKKSFERLLKYIPDDSDAAQGLMDVKDRIAAEAARAASEAAAKAAAEKAEERRKAATEPAAQPAPGSEEDVRRIYLEGVEHYTRGELVEAVARWREVLKLDPGNEKASSSIRKAEQKLRELKTKAQ